MEHSREETLTKAFHRAAERDTATDRQTVIRGGGGGCAIVVCQHDTVERNLFVGQSVQRCRNVGAIKLTVATAEVDVREYLLYF